MGCYVLEELEKTVWSVAVLQLICWFLIIGEGEGQNASLIIWT